MYPERTMSREIDPVFERRLSGLVNGGEPEILQGGAKGVEKESLRVTPGGTVAQTRHPEALGSALTNENITTDYSEALIELVTPTFATSWELLQYLLDLHQFVYRHLGDELLWATSMPCALEGDESIPIAQYGSSNVARMKTVYREGLGLRYGRIMQAISGVHFNYSFPQRYWEAHASIAGSGVGKRSRQDFISASYFDLLRNYRRYGWIVLYLFGVSPVVCKSFLAGHPAVDEPYATSLRMSDIGYRNRNQAALSVSVNNLEEYVRDLTRAIQTPYPPYEKLGVRVEERGGVKERSIEKEENGDLKKDERKSGRKDESKDGGIKYRQLNANILQIENEYYSYIRPKRVARSGERPTKALARAGVEYVEVRALDVSAFDPVGVNQMKLRFLEAFLALCLLKASPPIGQSEEENLDRNHLEVARRGRDPGLTLWRDGKGVPMRQWARELLDQMTGICEILDRGEPSRPYTQALATQAAKIDDVSLTPSARLMRELDDTGESFFQLALRMSRLHKDYFLELYPPNPERLAEFAAAARESWVKQRAIEAADHESFEAYLARYFAQ
jgi:glutamate--cysteine ligase